MRRIPTAVALVVTAAALAACSAPAPAQMSPFPTKSQQAVWTAAYLAHIAAAEPALRDTTVVLQVGQDLCQQMRLGNVTDQPGAFAYVQAKHLEDPSATSIAIYAPEYLCPDWSHA